MLNAIKTESDLIVRGLRENIAANNKKLVQKFGNCYTRMERVENKNKPLETKCINLERQVRKNLVLFDLNIPQNSDTIKFVGEKIEIDLFTNDISNLCR